MDRLNFNHLYYFYIVAKTGSIKEAAKKLFVSQPTISDQLKLLEDYFSCKLFERRNRSLTLTKQGELALEYAANIFDTSKDLTFRLRNHLQIPKKSLDIGITRSIAQYFLYEKILPLFDQSEVSINFTENEHHLLLADLEEGHLDIVFTGSKDSLSHSMNVYQVGVNRTFAVAHSKFKAIVAKFPEGLSNVPYFEYSEDCSLKYEIDLFFSKNSITPRIIGSANDMDLFQLVTENGFAFVIVPEIAKNRMCRLENIEVLGELTELKSSVYGIIKDSYTGLGYKLLEDLENN